MSKLTGKMVLVTGGSRGIGAATVKKLAAEGAVVHFTYHASKAPAEALATAVAEAGGEAHIHALNASQPETMSDFASDFIAQYGAPDSLILNAGVGGGGLVGEYSYEELRRIFTVNVDSVVMLTNAFVPHLKSGARIIVTSSALGSRATIPGIGIYNASKFAVNGFARSWAKDLGPRGILVNTVEPGPIDTDMNPDHADNQARETMHKITVLNRHGKAAEVANLIAFLASEEASYITGATLAVDGGWNA